jgi:hypothetical protein
MPFGFRDLPVVQGNLFADGLRRDKRPAAAHHPGQPVQLFLQLVIKAQYE